VQIGFYIDQTRCTGCCACVVACKDWHDVPAGPASWIRVKTIEKGRFPNLFVAFLPNICFHCENPACVESCPTGAISKQPDTGIVTIDQEACLGATCHLCKDNCPYDAPQFRDGEDAKMEKCDLCLDRLAEGKKPICIDGCPMRALDAGPMEYLIKTYGEIHEAEGFIYSDSVTPSVTFKPKTDSQNLPVQSVKIAPVPLESPG